MAEYKPLTRDQIEEKEALHIALTKWLNNQSMDTLGEAHEKRFGHKFDPEAAVEEKNKEDAARSNTEER